MRSLRNGSIVAAAVSYSLGVADALVNHSPNFKSPFAALVSSALLPGLGQMYTHSYRDLSLLGLSLLYVLNVIDAYVGAHLYYWNVDSDLAMRIYPSLTPSFGNASSGVLAMNFKLYF